MNAPVNIDLFTHIFWAMKSLHSQLRVKFTMIAVWNETKVITCFEMRKRISRYGAFLAFVGRSTARAIFTVNAAATSTERIYVTHYYYYCFILLLLCINLHRPLSAETTITKLNSSKWQFIQCMPEKSKNYLADIRMWPSAANTSNRLYGGSFMLEVWHWQAQLC